MGTKPLIGCTYNWLPAAPSEMAMLAMDSVDMESRIGMHERKEFELAPDVKREAVLLMQMMLHHIDRHRYHLPYGVESQFLARVAIWLAKDATLNRESARKL